MEHISSHEINDMPKKPDGVLAKDLSLSFESLTGGVGTTFYRAPEQEGGQQQGHGEDTSYDVQADIFSFGIVLFGKYIMKKITFDLKS